MWNIVNLLFPELDARKKCYTSEDVLMAALSSEYESRKGSLPVEQLATFTRGELTCF